MKTKDPSDRLRRLRELYEGAVEIDGPDERAEFLKRSCGDDSELRREVEELLDADGPGDNFLQPPARARGPGAELEGAFSEDARIGEFRLVRRLGAGGMGEVWEAEQESLGRRVALKLLLPGRVDAKSIEFFAREARAGGRLTHPGIVGVHGAGVDAGVHWIAMDLVENGRTLGDLVEEAREEDKLTAAYYRGIADLVAKLADALQAAHAKGVIHRDLKPLNVLLDPRGEPRVGDFGLARVENEHSLSRTGEFAGTYYYMSPEQVMAQRMGIDHRTDIFSLGVVLYELLSLVRPFEGDTCHQIAEKIVMIDPPDPRQLRSRVPRDMAVICAKAIEKKPAARYAEMSELAADLRRHLAHEPILARPVPLRRRVVKWGRRHPALMTATCVGAVALVAISALSGRLLALVDELGRKSEELMGANTELEGRTVELAAANEGLESEKREAERARDVAEAVNDFLNEDLLASVAPSVEAGRGRDVTVREVLDAAAKRVGERFTDQPLVKARIFNTLGVTYGQLGEYAAADPHYVAALEIYRPILGASHPTTLTLISNLGVILREQGRLAEAEAHIEEALEARRQMLGEEHPETLRSIYDLGTLRMSQGRPGDAEQLFLNALGASRRVLGDEHPTTVNAIHGMAYALREQGRLSEAEPLMREALEASRRVLGEEHTGTLASMNNMGGLLYAQGRYSEAEEHWRASLAVRRRVFGDQHPATLTNVHNVGIVLASQGRLPDAEPYIREALEGRRVALGNEHEDTLASISGLGNLLHSMGRPTEVEPLWREALETSRRVLGGEHPMTLISINAMGALLMSDGRPDEAEPLIREALEVSRRVHGVRHIATLTAMNNLGLVLSQVGRADEGRAYLEEAIAIRRAMHGDEHPDTLKSVRSMGLFLASRGLLVDAEPYFLEVVESSRRVLGETNPDTLHAIASLTGLYEDLGRHTEAATLARELLAGVSEEDPLREYYQELADRVVRAEDEQQEQGAPAPDEP